MKNYFRIFYTKHTRLLYSQEELLYTEGNTTEKKNIHSFKTSQSDWELIT